VPRLWLARNQGTLKRVPNSSTEDIGSKEDLPCVQTCTAGHQPPKGQFIYRNYADVEAQITEACKMLLEINRSNIGSMI